MATASTTCYMQHDAVTTSAAATAVDNVASRQQKWQQQLARWCCHCCCCSWTAAADTAAAAACPRLRVHFRFMWQSAPQGFIVLVQIGLGLLPMAAAEQTLSDQQLLRAVSAPQFPCSFLPPLPSRSNKTALWGCTKVCLRFQFVCNNLP